MSIDLRGIEKPKEAWIGVRTLALMVCFTVGQWNKFLNMSLSRFLIPSKRVITETSSQNHCESLVK
jgi:hypothetical protein